MASESREAIGLPRSGTWCNLSPLLLMMQKIKPLPGLLGRSIAAVAIALFWCISAKERLSAQRSA
jgi:hypothetical protein